MNGTNSFRFALSLESLDDRLNLSPVLPTDADRFAAPAPRPEPIVTIEYLVLGAVPNQATDDVWVERQIITAENYDSVAKPTAANDLTTPESRAEYMSITFSDVLVSSYQSGGHG